MFPDLTCDDIFRLETKRLWLRWPRVSDTAAIIGFAGRPEVAQMTALIPHPYPAGEAERFIYKSRAQNTAGTALTLAITQKGAGRPMIGLVSVAKGEDQAVELGYALSPAAWGKGFATEAVKALIEIVFGVTEVERIVANSRVGNPASRRVLEKCGFVYVDTGLDLLPARGGLHPCDRFRLDRKAWANQRDTRRIAPMSHQVREPSVGL